MTQEELPELNVDEHTAKMLPPEARYGKAQHGFMFTGYELRSDFPVIARLIAVHASTITKGSNHYIAVLQPEDAQDNRTFCSEIKEALVHASYKTNLEPIRFDTIKSEMTNEEAARFNWKDFDKRLVLCRYWQVEYDRDHWMLQIYDDGHASIKVSEGLHDMPFRWRKREILPDKQAEQAWFLGQSNASLDTIIRAQLDDPQSELRDSIRNIRWSYSTEAEKDTFAYECSNGTWNGLWKLAKQVLRVRLAQIKDEPQDMYFWDFTSYASTPLGREGLPWGDGHLIFWEDDFLIQWRRALIEHFQPSYIATYGIHDLAPLYIEEHLADSEQSQINTKKPSLEEALEAANQLISWADQNFPPERAQELIATLKFDAAS